jgi:hypothetical protein
MKIMTPSRMIGLAALERAAPQARCIGKAPLVNGVFGSMAPMSDWL